MNFTEILESVKFNVKNQYEIIKSIKETNTP